MSENNCSSSGGIGVGGVVAAVLSWMKWHSVGWALIHFCLGWAYVVYYLIEYGFHVG